VSAQGTKWLKFKWSATPEELAALKKYARITGQKSIADFLGFAVSEYIQLLQHTLDKTKEEALRADANPPSPSVSEPAPGDPSTGVLGPPAAGTGPASPPGPGV